MSDRPKISFVFPVHDPEYGGDLLGRTQRHLDALIGLANRYGLFSEIIIVEWNPRQDRAPFREALRWPDDLGHVCLRFIEVPAELHRTLPNADRIPIFEYIAKNAGLRRARGEFLLATNPDLFYSPALVRWLARTPLAPGKFYRVDRWDLSQEIPNDLSLSGRLRFCSRHVAQVHALFGSYRAADVETGRRLKDEYDRLLQGTTGATRLTKQADARLIRPADGLHRNAAGDFFLMEREWWHRLRGYPELHTHAHIDAILCWVASSAGLVQEILPSRCHLYHQVHDRASHGGFPQTDWKPWYERYNEAVRPDPLRQGPPMVVNLPDWGLANEVLPEWQADPRLVRVERRVAELDEHGLREKLTETEASLATMRSDLQRAHTWLREAEQKQVALGAALRKTQSAHEAERAAAERIRSKVQRARKAERAALKAALREAQAAQRSEAARRHTLESSTLWRITRPIRGAMSAFARLRPAPPHPPRVHDVEASRSKTRKNGLAAESKTDRALRASHPHAPPLEGAGHPSFPELNALRVFHVPGDAPRVTLVTGSTSAGSLAGGRATALVTGALLARHLGARLRVITLTDPPEPGNVAAVFATHRVPWIADIEFIDAGPRGKEEAAIGDHELFLTTSWWSTRRVLPIADPTRIVYLVEEDERMLGASADDRRRCVEILSNPDIRFVITSRLLFNQLTQGPDPLPNVLARGVWFDAAHVNQDWEAILTPVLAHLYPDRRLA